MISVYNVNKFCKDDPSLIENYDEAINSPEKYDCHHRLEIDLNLSIQKLKERDLYFNRPASELIFLTKAEHSRLHMTGEKNSMYGKHSWNYGLKGVQQAWNKGISPSEETRKKQSDSHKGQDPWNKGLKGAQKAHNKGKKRHTREDGTHYYA